MIVMIRLDTDSTDRLNKGLNKLMGDGSIVSWTEHLEVFSLASLN